MVVKIKWNSICKHLEKVPSIDSQIVAIIVILDDGTNTSDKQSIIKGCNSLEILV